MKRFFAFFVAAAMLLSWRGSWADHAAFKVVVNSQNSVQSLSRAQVSALFLKKSSSWEDGRMVLPVDLPEESAAREAFTREVLKKTVWAVKSYWQQKIFSGREVPPLEKTTDTEVLAYVRANPGAIGYVSAGAPTGDLKTLKIED